MATEDGATAQLVRFHDEGLRVLDQIGHEYRAARNSAEWKDGRYALIERWRVIATAWIKECAASLRNDSLAFGRFRAAEPIPVVPHGENVEWAGIHGTIEAKLEALRSIIDQRRRPAPAVAIGTAGAINFGTVYGDVRSSVVHLEQTGHAELAALLTRLIEKLPAAGLSDPERDDAAQLTRALADEAAKTARGSRLSAVGRATAQALGSILTRSAELAQIWQAIEPHLK